LHPPAVSSSVHVLYDFEPVSGKIAERAAIYLYGRALEQLEASQGSLQGIAGFSDRGAVVTVSLENGEHVERDRGSPNYLHPQITDN